VVGVQFPAKVPILCCDISFLHWIPGASYGVKRPGCETDHSEIYMYIYIHIYTYIYI
jgi:hypothetical protein